MGIRNGWWREALELVFPRTCLACGKAADAVRLQHLCKRCDAKVRRVESPSCSCCGHPFYGDYDGLRVCPHCLELTAEFGVGRTLTLARGPARAMVHALKYHRKLEVLEDMEQMLRENVDLLDFVRDGVLVPVPLHPRKQRHRGYNQTRLLAEVFAKAAGGGTKVMELLLRQVDTVTQTAYDRTHRQANLKNAFALLPTAVINPAFHYILVDDVFTTGSTLNSCAGVLRQAGCLNLDVVTFGHG